MYSSTPNPQLQQDKASRRRVLLAVICSVSCYGITIGLSFPLLSLTMKSWGVDASIIGANAAMAAFGTILISPLIPQLMARFGARRFIGACIAIEALLFISFPLTQSVEIWFLIRFALGASSAGLFVASETWINEVADERTRGRVMGFYNMLLSATIAIGPLILQITGIDGWLPFAVGAGFIAAAIIPLLWADLPLQVQPNTSTVRLSIRTFASQAPTLAGGVLLVSIMFMATSALLPIFAVDNGIDSSRVSALVTTMLAGGVALQLPIGYLLDHYSRRGVMLGCALGSAVGAVLLPFAIADPIWIWPLLFVWGGLFSSMYTVAMTMAGERYKGILLARAMAAFGILWGLGSLIGPGIAGYSMDALGPSGLCWTLAVFCGLFSALVLLRWRYSHRDERG